MAVSLDNSALAELAHWSDVGDAALGLTRTLEDEHFPGAIIPAVCPDGSAVFYALASTAPAWRRLQPLLVAFAGATFTDFDGVPSNLDQTDPLERFLCGAGLYAVARMLPGTFSKAPTVTLRALRSMQDAISRAPDLVAVRTEPTSILLARLQDALNAGDIEAASAVHATLRNELRLDAQNLLQLEFQILAASGDWAAIASHPDFELLCASGPSPATAEILLEALYWTHFSPAPAGSSIDEGLQSLIRSLLTHVGKAPPSAVQALIEWLSIVEPAEASAEFDGIAEASQTREPETSPPDDQAGEVDALSAARAALLALAANEGSALADAEARAVIAVDCLSEVERENLLSRPVFRALWHEIDGRAGPSRPPSDWTEWLACLSDPEFDSTAYARRAASEWRLPNADVDPASFAGLASAIDEVPDGLAGDRLNQSLPYLVEWAAADPAWPRIGLCPVYLSLLTRIALSTRRGETVIKSAAVLLESALRSGLSAAEYRDAMGAVSVIAEEAFNRNTAYDVFELADVARSFPPVEASVLADATAAIVTAAFGLFERLSAGQQLACSRLAAQIGWETEIPTPISEPRAEMECALSEMTVGIYTLTETAGRNAQSVLASLAPGIRVELNHDHDATAALDALVARVDLFVVAWASAKHAATNFIKARRGSKPLVYALGKGASSLIRAIEDFVAKAPSSYGKSI